MKEMGENVFTTWSEGNKFIIFGLSKNLFFFKSHASQIARNCFCVKSKEKNVVK